MSRFDASLLRLAALGLLLIGGCASRGDLEDTEHWPTDRSLVAGRIAFLIDGERKGVPSSPAFGFWSDLAGEYRLILHEQGEPSARTYELGGKGFYFWALDPGRYRIVGVDRTLGTGNFYYMDLGLDFTVPEARGDHRLPTIELVIGPGSWGFNLDDEVELLEQATRRRFPDREPALERLEVVALIETGNVGTVISECDDRWQRACTDDQHGVAALSPEPRSASGVARFTPVGDLKPQLEWAGSADPEVEYDLIVWEALPYRTSMVEDERFARGRIVTYVEGLAEPTHRLTEPLEPDRFYYWSVRYRRGATVSAWSTYSYAGGNPLIFWQYGGRLRFAFRTPPAE